MESRGHQTDITANHKYNKLDDILGSKISQMGKNRRIEGHKKVKEDEFDHNVDAPQKSIQNYEADEYEENGESRMIKMVEKFECSEDNILPQITVEHYKPKQSKENQTNLSVKLENHCDKLENLSGSRFYRIEESKKNEGHSKVKVDEFGHNVEKPKKSVQNYESDQYEADEYEENCKSMIIKVEKFECSDDILPDIAVEHYEPEESLENHTKVPQESVQNYESDQYEADEYQENCKSMIIKVEKFECSDDILPDIVVEHYKPEQSINHTKVSVKLGHRCVELENLSESKNYQIEESKRNKWHSKVKVDKFGHNVEESQGSVQNYESDQYEGNEENMIIKVEKFECSDDILPDIAVEHYEPEQSIERQTKVSVKFGLHYDKLSNASQASLIQPENCEESKDCLTVVASAVYEVSSEGNSTTKPYSKQRRRGGNLSENQNCKVLNKIDAFDNISDNYEDTVRNELSEDDDSISVNTETSKVLGSDSQCYVALDKLSYKCEICRYVTVIKELLVSHMKLHYKQSDSVNECELQLKNQIISEKYELKQIFDKLFACNLCSYKCTQKLSLQKHQLQHTCEKPFACNLCSEYKSADKSSLQKHQLTHTGEKLFACKLCSYKSAQKSHLQRHQLTHTGEKPFACNLCPYKSAHKSHLQRHQLTHTGEKPFACNLCPYKSVQKSQLQIHLFKHTGKKPFACNLCSYKSAVKSSLHTHQLTHTGEKPFACNLCSFKSTGKSHLQTHLLKHTGEKPFACNLCSFKSTRKSHLQTHQLTHTGEKPFACNLCSYNSTRKSDLKKHQLKYCSQQRDRHAGAGLSVQNS